jgi:hypothetical protein
MDVTRDQSTCSQQQHCSVVCEGGASIGSAAAALTVRQFAYRCARPSRGRRDKAGNNDDTDEVKRDGARVVVLLPHPCTAWRQILRPPKQQAVMGPLTGWPNVRSSAAASANDNKNNTNGASRLRVAQGGPVSY